MINAMLALEQHPCSQQATQKYEVVGLPSQHLQTVRSFTLAVVLKYSNDQKVCLLFWEQALPLIPRWFEQYVQHFDREDTVQKGVAVFMESLGELITHASHIGVCHSCNL